MRNFPLSPAYGAEIIRACSTYAVDPTVNNYFFIWFLTKQVLYVEHVFHKFTAVAFANKIVKAEDMVWTQAEQFFHAFSLFSPKCEAILKRRGTAITDITIFAVSPIRNGNTQSASDSARPRFVVNMNQAVPRK